uniref:peptidylprolyl isomerase n=1 Tax=Hanusia phi TaxID=3032 RepID=A0A7S0HUJ1_9CRYP
MSMARGRTFLALQAAVILFASPSLCFSPSCVKLRSPGKGSSLRAPRPSVMMSVKPEQNVDSFEKRISKLTNTVFSGILGASLILSPAMVPTDSPVSYGGTAYAQGATSSKVTRGAPSVDANKDPESILRLSLPINPKNPIREAQAELEMKMDKAFREIRGERWSKILGYSRKALNIVSSKSDAILKDVSPDRQAEGKALLDEVKSSLESVVKSVETQDVSVIEKAKRGALEKIGLLEELMIKDFPFQIPKEYAKLPQLKGRAVVEMTIKKAADGAKFDVDGTVYEQAVFRVVCDGYTAPINAGAFVDLVNRGFYNGMAVQRSDGFVVQTGDPEPENTEGVHGLKNSDGSVRTLPLEVFADGDKEPTYETTLEDDGRPLAQPKLPFSVYGTLAMARSEDNANDASTQFFFLLFDPELTTAGRNLMDGRFSTFGYVVEGNRLLSNVEVGDKIVSAKVISGLDNLVVPK